MPQLGYLPGLWAFAALAVPLILHLWRPPAITVRIGSLRFLQGLPRERLRAVRLRDHLLLVVRLLLLALLALLLAAPFWRHVVAHVPQKWVLLSPDVSLDSVARKRLDALKSSGYEVHGLSTGYPIVDSASGFTSSVAPGKQEPSDVWSMIRELDATLPFDSALAVFTRGRISDLQGRRPTLRRCRVEWVQTSGDREKIHAWVRSMEFVPATSPAELDVVIGVSSSVGTRYLSQKIPARADRIGIDESGAHLGLEITGPMDGKFSARVVSTAGKPAGEWVSSSQRASLRVLIFHGEDREQDAKYLEAAVRTAAKVSGREIVLTGHADDQQIPETLPSTGWAFWLSGQTVPERVMRLSVGGWKLVTDAGTWQSISRESVIAIPSDVASPRLSTDTVAINKRVATPRADFVPWWTDGFGESLLIRERTGVGERLDFLGRFHPAWNDLPRTGALSAMLLSLFNDESTQLVTQRMNDRRIAGFQQGTPDFSADKYAKPAETSASETRTDLHMPFWMLAALCFCAERLLSHWLPLPGQQRKPNNAEKAALEVAPR